MSIFSGDELYGDEVTSGPSEDERDYTQELKDDRPMGLVNEDGTVREPDESDWSYQGLIWPDGSPQEQYHDDDPLTGEAPF